MTDHDADVAAVLAGEIAAYDLEWDSADDIAKEVLAALTAANYAVVKLPENEMCQDCSGTALRDHEAPCRACNGQGHTGVAVEHGARLVRLGLLHETNRGKQVDIGPEREACYWDCRYGCKRPAVYAIEATP